MILADTPLPLRAACVRRARRFDNDVFYQRMQTAFAVDSGERSVTRGGTLR